MMVRNALGAETLKTSSFGNGFPYSGNPYADFLTHGSGQRVQTGAVEVRAIRACHPDRALAIVRPGMPGRSSCDLLSFANEGFAKAVLAPQTSQNILERQFISPARRHSEEGGAFSDNVVFAAYDYEFEGKVFLLYVMTGKDDYMQYICQYLLGPAGSKHLETEGFKAADALIEAASRWSILTHDEVLVFDRGFWNADKQLFKSIKSMRWDDVILDKGKKNAMIDDVESFFSGEQSYAEFAVPWKRGLIFYGPPGNGKTISIKALMNTVTERTDPSVELLYVKSLNSFMGPEVSINSIFDKARLMAPCLLIFEDIDSLIDPSVRSYFLNAVDGLESNHGILMIGSTNHLERLDPGIAKRPSRFDRKILFDLPNQDERVQYCEYWRKKLKGNKKIAFPEPLCGMIADITDKFSFAYMKEAFVASLMAIRRHQDDASAEAEAAAGASGGGDGKDEAEKSLLWNEIQKQVKILREEMDNDAMVKEDKPAVRDEAKPAFSAFQMGANGLTIRGGLTVLGSQQPGRPLP